MRRSNAYVAARRDSIMAILEREGHASVSDLAERFSVSVLTIRRDLDWLESRHVLSRQHGSATLLNPLGRPSGSSRIRANRAIAREAAKHVKDGDCIFLNGSSTALNIIDFITANDVTVVTNNCKVLLIGEHPNVSILLTGGEIRPPKASMVGKLAMDNIREVNAAKCFLGCTGLSVVSGITSATAPEPAINALMLERSREHYVVADSSKLGLVSSFSFGTVDEIDILFTDTGATGEQVSSLLAHGVGSVVRTEPTLDGDKGSDALL
uniref:DeoR/GlpR family DNA-binding transcription regulator n=1 Tax=Parolsenella massiliensis TaxID=1871022 RepID=UPI000932FF14|nr:DeoR/GlpR family DNA-binding transcription regulator [Parolsenella massiliensis]